MNDMEQSADLYRTLFESSAEAMLALHDGRIIAANAAACRLFRLPPETLAGERITTLVDCAPPMTPSTSVRQRGELQLVTGEAAPVDLVYSTDASGRLALCILRAPRINNVVEPDEALTRAIQVDDLTGLSSRRAFFEGLRAEYERCRSSAGRGILMLLDVDNLKLVNDSFGHPAGDHLLQATAARLKALTRASDIVARIGGDEFALVLPDMDVEAGRRLKERLARAVDEQPIIHDDVSDRDIWTGISIGLVSISAAAASIDELITAADRDMYSEKRRHRAASRAEEPPDSGPPTPERRT